MKGKQQNSSQKFPLISGMLQQFLSQGREPILNGYNDQQNTNPEAHGLPNTSRQAKLRQTLEPNADIERLCEIADAIRDTTFPDIANILGEIYKKLEQAHI
ncbi:hypothetical protein DI09_55p170 [Mitosporidium daphniae]|uniref:Uncharacterized protein n=1 Tax=Mitosporidium daphniae TaxID=1485682 RepID=A0A098VPB1_9MICR|nr:uncharacterized protein DI09_55p170 [Mitosporidium daphniae]KGG50800.1 hypothetical protein DI09_55p170 [Mitosporidium daphniae]|eukprot:XP_013237227.1 uncharacterized protein DI09_55p170 [Mitosporidium daphniae]